MSDQEIQREMDELRRNIARERERRSQMLAKVADKLYKEIIPVIAHEGSCIFHRIKSTWRPFGRLIPIWEEKYTFTSHEDFEFFAQFIETKSGGIIQCAVSDSILMGQEITYKMRCTLHE